MKLSWVALRLFMVVVIAAAAFILCCKRSEPLIPLVNDSQFALYERFVALSSPHQITIPPPGEPGDRLIVCGQLFRREDNTAISGQEVFAYHTDLNGKYSPDSAEIESTARLSGTAITDNLGRFTLQTIFPNGYSGLNRDGSHIHMRIDRASPDAYDIFFEQYVDNEMRNFIEGSDQFTLPKVHSLPNGELVVFVDILVKNYGT